jgi:triosephosphate isomerase (TIM)
MTSGRTPIAAGNWKMHHLRADAEAWCRTLRAGLEGPEGEAPGCEVLVLPSFPLLPAVAAGLDGVARLGWAAWGGQDLHPEDLGAHTGDVSAAQLADAGCSWALAGHSERRHDHGEGDGLVARKVAAALRHGLAPMICVGETKAERDAGETFEILEGQLAMALAPVIEAGAGSDRFALAYEPVWAIGTGDTATPETAQEAHRFLRRCLAEHLPGRPEDGAADAVRILYGGSVKPANAADLIAGEDVDGFLVGGASLDAEEFLAIIRCCA